MKSVVDINFSTSFVPASFRYALSSLLERKSNTKLQQSCNHSSCSFDSLINQDTSVFVFSLALDDVEAIEW